MAEAIKIVEELVYPYLNEKSYEHGIVLIDECLFRPICNPSYLVELYYKSQMYDKCWKLLNLMLEKYSSQKTFIREYQSKISSKEERNKDSLLYLMLSIVNKHHEQVGELLKEKIEKQLFGKIKKAELIFKKDDIISIVINNINNKNKEYIILSFMKEIS